MVATVIAWLDKPLNPRLVLLSTCILTGLLFVCGLDFDHIPKYLFGFNLPGRLLHDPFVFSLLSLLFGIILFAFVIRWLLKNQIPLVEREEDKLLLMY